MERIRRRAHEMWERDGRPEGMHEVHWLQACREIDAEDRSTAQTSTSPRRKKASDEGRVAGTVRRSAKKAVQAVSSAAEAISGTVASVTETVVQSVAPKRVRRTKAAAATNAQTNSAPTISEDAPKKAVQRSRSIWSPEDIKPAASSKAETVSTRKAARGIAKQNVSTEKASKGERASRPKVGNAL